MARPRTPTAQKRLQGTYQRSRDLERESVRPAAPPISPDPPATLSGVAAAYWRYAVDNDRKGLLTVLDQAALERWAHDMAMYQDIANRLPHDDPELSPLFRPFMRIAEELTALEIKLGFTPKSRRRIIRQGGG